VVTVRANRQSRALEADMRLVWALFPGRTYLIRGGPVLDERRGWITLWATAFAGGPGA
jgi:hypothetical protein